jgi:hypothetical protein
MSRLVVSSLEATSASNKIITVESGHRVVFPAGAIIQAVHTRSDTRTSYASNITGNGTTITDLNMAITPKFANSLLVMTWVITGEVSENNVFLVHQNGAIITRTGYQSYNGRVGNSRWSGLLSGKYDQADVASTPNAWTLQYAVPAVNTSARTYAPAIRSGTSTAYTFYLNRPALQIGDAYETSISNGVILEISQ